MTRSRGTAEDARQKRFGAEDVEAALRKHVNPRRRDFLSAGYAPTGLVWLGVPVPALRTVAMAITREMSSAPPSDVVRLAAALAARKTIEVRQVGYELLQRRADALAALDRPTIERLGRGNDNWASVDAFATSVTGPAWRTGVLADRDLLVWARSDDPWWRRTAIVSTVSLNTPSRGGSGDPRRTLLICRAVLSREMTPMLAKALSWALRTLAPRDGEAVRLFLDRHRARLPAIVHREVTTKLTTGRKAKSRQPT